MIRKELRGKLTDLLDGKLSPQEEEEVLAELERSGIPREEIESIRSVSKAVDATDIPEPPVRMDNRFYTMLEEEKKKVLPGEPEFKPERSFPFSFFTPGLRIAAGIALFILGWFSAGWFGMGTVPAGRQIANLAGEVKQLKETLILTMMQESSPSERIRAVTMVSDLDKAESQIINGLIGVLNKDSNNNVRLLALDALIRYASVPEVRDGLVASIGNQTSPLVQLRLAEIMIALNEKRAVPEFQKVLQDASLNYGVRDKLSEAVFVLL